ncbi:hypothetical protein CYMTET_35854 [Cymbomonas tetramitiformis]|uniref:protein-serine/threonine phosphatase n=1 Tax=Cymbomonas tetramitiformis TaxID=36881 RepID=A0AAE0F8E9_9CHLO|nr:hypothetical protein CYMTET_42500 [Cymbomonas tetramitiformis]KAK3254949.1 hypothetical protein CYMTET_35854 [Cymbomonas tetramitiformis]
MPELMEKVEEDAVPDSPFLPADTVRLTADAVDQSKVEAFEIFIRAGVHASQGSRTYMEDAVTVEEDISSFLRREQAEVVGSCSYFGVYDGHGGTESAEFVRDRLLPNIISQESFPEAIGKSMHDAFLQTDAQLRDTEGVKSDNDFSGTTAIAIFLSESTLHIANCGDSRVVMSSRGKAIALSSDHKPTMPEETSRIKAARGFIEDGYLNGQLGTGRALGNWYMDLKDDSPDGTPGPLTARPDTSSRDVCEGDEFLLIACDGLWDVFSNQNAVEYARQQLRVHNDPQTCSEELVKEALRRNSTDNISVVTVCFSKDPPPKREFKDERPASFRRTLSQESLSSLHRALSKESISSLMKPLDLSES